MRDERTPKDVRGEAISQCENSEVQIAAFSKCTMYKDSFFVYVQPCVNENL